MSILSAAKPEAAYLKLGLYGEAGSGKTFTASKVAIGLRQYIKSDKPIAFADTETGSDYVRHLFEDAGIKLMSAKTRAFSDLLGITDEAEKECAVLIVDSISHYWTELQDAWMKKNNLTRINWMKHSAPIKAIWRDFTERYVNSKLHIIICGRSSPIYEDVIDPEDGSKESRKTGTKMKTENEMGYEPSLLAEMTPVQLIPSFGGKLVRRAFVKKDRFDILDGKLFDNPTFESFLPHIEKLNLGGDHKALETGRDSLGLIRDENSGEKRALNKEILCEKITNEIKKLYPGQSEKDKAARIALLEGTFGTNSWTEISTLFRNDRLEAGLDSLRAKVAEVEGPAPEPEPVKPIPPPDNGKPKTKGARA
jgi:hypothetical protein